MVTTFVLKGAMDTIWLYEPVKIMLTIAGAQWEFVEIPFPSYLVSDMVGSDNATPDKLKKNAIRTFLNDPFILLHRGLQVQRGRNGGVTGAVNVIHEVARLINFGGIFNEPPIFGNQLFVVAQSLGNMFEKWSDVYVENDPEKKEELTVQARAFSFPFLTQLNEEAHGRSFLFLFRDEMQYIDVLMAHILLYIENFYNVRIMEGYLTLEIIVERVTASEGVRAYLENRALTIV